jgi:hypothetical protein
MGLRAEDPPTLHTANDHVMQGASEIEAQSTRHTHTRNLPVYIRQLSYDRTRRLRSISPTRSYVPLPQAASLETAKASAAVG